MNEKQEKVSKEFFYSKTFVFAVFPVLSYAVVYFFERGYLAFYGLNNVFFVISIENVILAFFILFVSVYLIFGPINFFSELRLMLPEDRRDRTLNIIFFIFLILGFFYYGYDLVYGASSFLTIFFFVFFAFTLIFDFGHFKVLYEKGFGAYFDYVGRAYNYNSEVEKIKSENLLSKINKKVGINLEQLFVHLFVFIQLLPFFVGVLDAYFQSNYLVTDINQSKYALVRSYSNVSLFVEVHEKWVSLYEKQNFLGHKFLMFQSLPDGAVYESLVIHGKEKI